MPRQKHIGMFYLLECASGEVELYYVFNPNENENLDTFASFEEAEDAILNWYS